jgi:hypothetical protein
VQRGLGVLGYSFEDPLVGLHRPAGRCLAGVELVQGRLREEVEGYSDRLNPLTAVLFGRQVVGP